MMTLLCLIGNVGRTRQNSAMPSERAEVRVGTIRGDCMDLYEDETMNLDGDIIPGYYVLYIGFDDIVRSSL